MDLAVALKGRPVLTRNLTADTASEGEIRCDKIGKEVPAKRGKSRISMEPECGELSVGETKKILKQIAAYDQSEGEIEPSGASHSNKSPKKIVSNGKSTSPVPMARRSPTPTRSLERRSPPPKSPPPKSPSPTKGLHMPQEKTVVDLSVSPKRSSKNNIRVQPIRKCLFSFHAKQPFNILSNLFMHLFLNRQRSQLEKLEWFREKDNLLDTRHFNARWHERRR